MEKPTIQEVFAESKTAKTTVNFSSTFYEYLQLLALSNGRSVSSEIQYQILNSKK